jgi:hypothetical protein
VAQPPELGRPMHPEQSFICPDPRHPPSR